MLSCRHSLAASAINGSVVSGTSITIKNAKNSIKSWILREALDSVIYYRSWIGPTLISADFDISICQPE